MLDIESLDQPPSELLSARDALRERLLHDILHAAIEPLPVEQDPLTENAIMTRYEQGSRMPVRMALAVLAGEGLVRQRARHGYWLVQYEADDVVQILGMRSGVEVMVAVALNEMQRASVEASDQPLGDRLSLWHEALNHQSAMGDLATLAQSTGDVDWDREAAFADADTAFHRSLAQAAGYDLAARHIVDWRNQMRIFRLQQKLRYDPGALAEIHAEHARILETISSGDAGLAAEVARSHVGGVMTRMRALVPAYA